MFQIGENKTTYIIDDKIMGEIDYPNIDDNTVNITHTFVDPSLRGQGIADKMMHEVFNYLHEHNKKVIYSCSYAQKWVEHHLEEICQEKKTL